jgi:hypothetical protein
MVLDVAVIASNIDIKYTYFDYLQKTSTESTMAAPRDVSTDTYAGRYELNVTLCPENIRLPTRTICERNQALT